MLDFDDLHLLSAVYGFIVCECLVLFLLTVTR